MAKIYELTGLPVVAAMSCFRLKEIANILHEAYPLRKLLIMADNDWETARKRDYNPGIEEAQAVVSSKLALDVIASEFSPADTGCSDWDDFATKYGDEKTKDILQRKIEWACLTEAQGMEIVSRNSILKFIHNLDPTIQLPPQEFIGGNIFDGFAENEPVHKSLILAGEAGYELLTRRAASMKWPLNTQNIFVLDQYEAETNNVSVMLNEDEGWLNISRLVDMYRPDILFIDTFSSFHEKDENKAPEMKPIIKKLAVLAKLYNMAIVLVHHPGEWFSFSQIVLSKV